MSSQRLYSLLLCKCFADAHGTAADTRTNNTIGLGLALVQHHHTGVLPSETSRRGVLPALPLSDPLAAMMPESWVRGAIVVRTNSLIRGHSAVRWELLEQMVALLRENITPCVPLRGSISACGGMSVFHSEPVFRCGLIYLFFFLLCVKISPRWRTSLGPSPEFATSECSMARVAPVHARSCLARRRWRGTILSRCLCYRRKV
jgi:hypothetical protein